MERVHLADRGSAADPGADARALGPDKRERWAKEFLKEEAALRRYVLRELERRGPVLSRELEHHAARADERYVWWGTRAQLTWMLELLHRAADRSDGAAVGGQRLWDLAERWYPDRDRAGRRSTPGSATSGVFVRSA